jgi:hypothetical protein
MPVNTVLSALTIQETAISSYENSCLHRPFRPNNSNKFSSVLSLKCLIATKSKLLASTAERKYINKEDVNRQTQ